MNRRSSPRRLPAGLGVALAALLLAPQAASAHGPDPTLSSTTFDQDETLRFRWRAGSEPPSAIKTAVKAAAGDIGESRASRAALFAYDAGGANPIGYGAGATCGVNGIACFTRNAPTSFTMWLREQGHVFDWGTLRWCQMYADPPTGCYDAETIALDEFGHVEGLAHHVNYSDDRDYLDAVVQTYSRTRPKDGWDEHALGRCDVATLQRTYDVPSTSTRITTCLDLDTVATIAASTSATVYGGTVRFTATLRVATSSAYGRLSNNALSGRTVRLQSRPAGGSSWTTIATMTPGSSGSYTGAATITADTEFRALFSTPSNEGLNGDGSGTVAVDLSACSAVSGKTLLAAPCAAPDPR